MTKTTKPKTPAKRPAKPAIMPRQLFAPICNPVPVLTAAEWIYRQRKAYADFDAKSKPDSYGNGCRDGATLAEGQLLRLAQGYGALAIDLFQLLALDPLALEKQPQDPETLKYRKGLLAGYIGTFHDYLAPGGPASLSIAHRPGGMVSHGGGHG